MDVMTKLAAHFQAKATEESQELSKLADRQTKLLDEKKSLRAALDYVNSAKGDGSLTGNDELKNIERMMKEHGLDTKDIDSLLADFQSQNGRYVGLKIDGKAEDGPWYETRRKSIEAIESKLKNAKDNASDSDDQVSFEIQQRFSAYSRSINQASTTEQKRKEFDDQIIQKWG